LSREAYPKQFLALHGSSTMLQATWQRVQAIASGPPIVVSKEEHRFMVAEQLREAGCVPSAILLEPVGRNTAPAIAVAAMEAMADGRDPLLLVLPSDHVIVDDEGFRIAVRDAEPAARAGALVTFGIVPTAPETGYGYIRAEGGGAMDGDGIRKVAQFVEKPDATMAACYVASREYLWNSGMFLFRASRYLGELARLQPAMHATCRTALERARRDEDFVRLDHASFSACPSDSIDYAVMEKTTHAAVLPVSVGWNDMGSWSALWQVAEQDGDGNAHRGDVIARHCRNTMAWGDSRLVALLGLEDVMVVDTADAVLVAHRSKIQDVKSIVSALKAQGRPEPTRR